MVPGQFLEKISADVIRWLRELPDGALFNIIAMKDYHGFAKSRLPERILGSILMPYGLTPADIQVEIVAVTSDLSHEIHLHKEAHAFATILGAAEHVDNPRRAYGFKGGDWFPVTSCERVDIPEGIPHTFTVTEPGGILYFLSVQAPPIEREGGADDYQMVSGPKPPVLWTLLG